jgi:hypothetical protein
VLVDSPRKFVVQFPGNESEDKRCDGHENGMGDQLDADLLPNIVFDDEAVRLEDGDGIVNLVELDTSIDEDADVVKDESNDLNGVLLAQGIIYKNKLVDEAEHEDGEVRGDGARLVVVLRNVVAQARLEFCKDISAQSRSACDGGRVSDGATYDSRVRAMMAWMMAVNMKAHVHRVLGIYCNAVSNKASSRTGNAPSSWSVAWAAGALSGSLRARGSRRWGRRLVAGRKADIA